MNMETPNFTKQYESELNKVELAKELMENNEELDFPGLNIESYNTLKSEEKEYLGFATSIDEIIIKCEDQGLKIEMGSNLDGSNMFLLPADSNNLDDSLRFKHLNLDSISNGTFKKLANLLVK